MLNPSTICKRTGCDLPKWTHGGDYCPRHAVPERIRHNLPDNHQSHAGNRDALRTYPDGTIIILPDHYGQDD